MKKKIVYNIAIAENRVHTAHGGGGGRGWLLMQLCRLPYIYQMLICTYIDGQLIHMLPISHRDIALKMK